MTDLLTPSDKGAAGAMAAAFRCSAGPGLKSMNHLSIAKRHVRGLLSDALSAIPRTRDAATKLHLQYVAERLNEELDPFK